MYYLIGFAAIILAYILATYIVNRPVVQVNAVRTTCLVSFGFLSSWFLIEKSILHVNWWSISSSNLLLCVIISIVLVVVNIVWYYFLTNGSDYKPFLEMGAVSDGCPHQNQWAIPSNFITHSAHVIYEEILFRGFIGLLLYYVLGLWAAILIPSIAFGLLHYIPFRQFALKNNIKPDRLVAGAFISTCFFPAIFSFSNFMFNSLIPGWIMHTFLNCSVGLYLKYIDHTFKSYEYVN
jgi:membrane protease YdiL (CAAX protease family)